MQDSDEARRKDAMDALDQPFEPTTSVKSGQADMVTAFTLQYIAAQLYHIRRALERQTDEQRRANRDPFRGR